MRKQIVNVLVAIVLTMTCTVVYAAEKVSSTAGMKGIIINAKTKNPFKYINVQLLKVDKIENNDVFFSGKTIFAKTDKAGVFIFMNIKPGKYLFGLADGLVEAAPGSFKKNATKEVIEISNSSVLDLGTILRTE